ncbi:hypothetical protein GQ53DRAFT_753389 [Thozetella sp. PMI_491]|nr:hypothetical protein GQ53DRAFT_753389 [Thozetella sp. PMI_491]
MGTRWLRGRVREPGIRAFQEPRATRNGFIDPAPRSHEFESPNAAELAGQQHIRETSDLMIKCSVARRQLRCSSLLEPPSSSYDKSAESGKQEVAGDRRWAKVTVLRNHRPWWRTCMTVRNWGLSGAGLGATKSIWCPLSGPTRLSATGGRRYRASALLLWVK